MTRTPQFLLLLALVACRDEFVPDPTGPGPGPGPGVPVKALPFRLGSSQPDEARAVAISPAGDVMVASWFAGTTDFDPRSGATVRASFGAQDVAVARYSPTGEFQWVTQFGGTGGDVPTAIATTPDGGAIVTGYASGGICSAFAPAAHGGRDILLMKISPSGECDWALLIGGTQDDEGRAVSIDGNNVLVAGLFRGSVDFDLGPGSTVLVSRGGSDAFMARYDLEDGALLSLAQSGGLEHDALLGIGLAANGDITAVGEFNGQATFGSPSAPVILTSTGGSDIAVATYTNLFGLRWAIRAGGPLNDRATAMANDFDGSVIVAGTFEGTADFDPGPGAALQQSRGSSDAFIARYDGNSGAWSNVVRTVGGPGNEGVTSVIVTPDGMAITGWFQETVDFDPGSAVTLATARGTSGAGDSYVLALTATGDFSWVTPIGSVIAGDANLGIAYGVAVGADGALWTVGRFAGLVDFDQGTAAVTLQAAGATDQYVAALDPATGAVRVAELP